MTTEERRFLLDAFDSNWIAPLGPHVDAFERELCLVTNTKHACALCSGTAALHLALIVLEVGPGDDVFVSTLTFAATANAIRYVGANPVFIDSDYATWTMDPELLSEAIADSKRCGRLPKAVVTVDLYGQCADYDKIRNICDEYAIPIVQDAAEALGASYKSAPAGTQGLLSALSFNGNKIITTSGGGALLSARADLISSARHLSTQARDPAPHYQHSAVGYNYRLSNLLAAVGRAQLNRLSQLVAIRRHNFEEYSRQLGSLPGWSFMPEATYGNCNRWLTTALIDAEFGTAPEGIRLALERDDIETRPLWKPMHLQPIFSQCKVYGGSVSSDLFRRGICLPSGSSLGEDDRQRVIDKVLALRQP
jgi:dTDP-4-amino-4,6-dideoxygalactose transaminase